jgi:4-amino-4-deoxy-L-arabinose transferase-like glycosyltransferase
VAASEPPVYYALQTIPYALASSGSLLDRLALMRLLSALIAGVTALFCYLFVREAVPGVRWAWTVGGLSVALMPLLGFMSGAVNPDAMLYAVCAALFYALARAFRRGLTLRLAVAIGLLGALARSPSSTFSACCPAWSSG